MYVKDAMGRALAIVKIVTTEGTPAAAEYEYFMFGNERVARVTSSGTGVRPMRIYPGEVTYFLYDHLGNTRVSFQASGTTTLTATTVYCGDYYPYGKMLREYDAGDGDRYLTTMHERDDETGLDYRGARYYDCEVGRFLSIDPKAEKYPALSVYNYVAGNPVLIIDPDGKEIIIWYWVARTLENGETTYDQLSYKYGSGLEVPDNEFVKMTVEAIDYLIENELGYIKDEDHNILNELINTNLPVNIREGTRTQYRSGVIEFNPKRGLIVEGMRRPPAISLLHESGHKWGNLFDTDNYIKRREAKNVYYNSDEEEFVITKIETPAVEKLGLPGRTRHDSDTYESIGPTSTQTPMEYREQEVLRTLESLPKGLFNAMKYL